MALPKWATTVTPFSKALALIIFVSFPIIGFLLGAYYQSVISFQVFQDQQRALASFNAAGKNTGQNLYRCPSPSPAASIPADWANYRLSDGSSFRYPSNFKIEAASDGSVQIQGDDPIHKFTVKSYIIPKGKDIVQFIYEGGMGENHGKEYYDASRIQLTIKEVGSSQTYKILEPSQWPSRGGILIRFLQADDRVVSFGLEPYNAGGTPIQNEERFVKIYNQILSTFLLNK